MVSRVGFLFSWIWEIKHGVYKNTHPSFILKDSEAVAVSMIYVCTYRDASLLLYKMCANSLKMKHTLVSPFPPQLIYTHHSHLNWVLQNPFTGCLWLQSPSSIRCAPKIAHLRDYLGDLEAHSQPAGKMQTTLTAFFLKCSYRLSYRWDWVVGLIVFSYLTWPEQSRNIS